MANLDSNANAAAAHSPLTGKRILIPRPESQGSGFSNALKSLGATPIHIPLIAIHPIQDLNALFIAADQLRPNDWIFITSQNAIPAVLQVRARSPKSMQERPVYIAAVGATTAEHARAAGLRIDFVPTIHNSASLANELGERLHGRRVLLPRSDKASVELPALIRKYDGKPLEVITYLTELCDQNDTLRQLTAAHADAITLFSPTETEAYAQLLTRAGAIAAEKQIPVIAIGEVTAQSCRAHGLPEAIVATDTTISAVLKALTDCFTAQNENLAGAKQQ